MAPSLITTITIVCTLLAAFIIFRYIVRQPRRSSGKGTKIPPDLLREILTTKIRYYTHLTEGKKREFEERVNRFLSEKKITGVDTEITDDDRVMVASSAVIPMFGFPYYRYPGVYEVILYPNSFDMAFQTNPEVAGRDILGMVGEGFLHGHVLLSRPDLEAAFDGKRHKNNVGIHEFVHLIDKADGATDGIPSILFDHSFAFSWIREIRKELLNIKSGHSDINPYALKNHAEFLAVVSEYFFDNPEKMKARHPVLYDDLMKIFRQNP